MRSTALTVCLLGISLTSCQSTRKPLLPELHGKVNAAAASVRGGERIHADISPSKLGGTYTGLFGLSELLVTGAIIFADTAVRQTAANMDLRDVKTSMEGLVPQFYLQSELERRSERLGVLGACEVLPPVAVQTAGARTQSAAPDRQTVLKLELTSRLSKDFYELRTELQATLTTSQSDLVAMNDGSTLYQSKLVHVHRFTGRVPDRGKMAEKLARAGGMYVRRGLAASIRSLLDMLEYDLGQPARIEEGNPVKVYFSPREPFVRFLGPRGQPWIRSGATGYLYALPGA